jgi:hypothetical protein
MKNARIGKLEDQIEAIVREHVSALRRTTEAAVVRAFSRVGVGGRIDPAPRTTASRRPATEMSALIERLYKAICARPGVRMAVLSTELGATPRQLNWPAKQLRRSGRVRSVGQRQFTRYFPMATKEAARS